MNKLPSLRQRSVYDWAGGRKVIGFQIAYGSVAKLPETTSQPVIFTWPARQCVFGEKKHVLCFSSL